MANRCDLTGKRSVAGKSISHSHRKTNRLFSPNIQNKKIYIPELGRSIHVKISTKALRTINKKGFHSFLRSQGKKLEDFI